MPRKRALKLEAADGIRKGKLGAYRKTGKGAENRVAWQEPPWYGTVCRVVWEDGGGNPASYPIPPSVRRFTTEGSFPLISRKHLPVRAAGR